MLIGSLIAECSKLSTVAQRHPISEAKRPKCLKCFYGVYRPNCNFSMPWCAERSGLTRNRACFATEKCYSMTQVSWLALPVDRRV